MHELKRLAINVDDHFLAQNLMLPLFTCLHNGVHFFVISGIPVKNMRQCFNMIGNGISLLSEDDNDNIVKGIRLNIKWLL
jgi:hypothetical protein